MEVAAAGFVIVLVLVLVLALVAVYYFYYKPSLVTSGTASPGDSVPLAGASVGLPGGATANPNGTTTLPNGGTVATTPAVLKVFGCEAAPAVLSCPSGQVIGSGGIKYGRWDMNTCPHPTVTPTTAPFSKDYNLPSQFLGKQTATLTGFNNILNAWNTPAVYKQYEINYTCK